MTKRLLAFVVCMVASLATVASPHKNQRVDYQRIPRFIENLSDIDCDSVNGNHSKLQCTNLSNPIFVAPAYNESETLVGCVAFFPYNSLKMHTTPNGESITVLWTLGKRSKDLFPPLSKITLKGIAFTVSTTDQTNVEPFPDGGGVLTTDEKNGTATLSIGKTTKLQSFGHLPLVQVTLPHATKALTCTGGDPLISNGTE